MNGELTVFSGTSNRRLAEGIARYLKIKLSDGIIGRFSDGEISCKINRDVRGRDVFVVQPSSPPVNENLMELLIMIDALRRASARRITAVTPYFGYARQDRKDQPRVPITAKLVANLITTAGADRLLTMDLHAPQVQGFFDIPVDHLFAAPVMIDYLKKRKIEDMVTVSPDVGGIKMARAFAKHLGSDLAIVDKRRIDAKRAEVMHILGDVKGRNAVIVDDMITTAGSVTEAALALKKNGAREIYVCASHGVFSGPALERLQNSPIKSVIVTDSIPARDNLSRAKITVLSIASLMGEAIKRIHNEESVSSLFEI